jgi:hypothetical protein
MAPASAQSKYLSLHNKVNERKVQPEQLSWHLLCAFFLWWRWVMVTESTIFYLVLLTLLTWLINVLLTKSSRRHDRHSHA